MNDGIFGVNNNTARGCTKIYYKADSGMVTTTIKGMENNNCTLG